MKKFGKSRKSGIVLVLFLIPVFCVVSMAANSTGTPNVEKAPPTIIEQKMLQKITLNYRDVAIDEILRAISEQVDLNIVKSPEITKTVTVSVTNVPLGEALNQILSAYDCGYVASENIIRVVPASQLAQETERTVSKIYRIWYASVKDVEQALAKIVTPNRGSVTASIGTSNIIVSDTESKIKAIDEFLKEIDRPTPLILVEVRIYDITSRDNLDIGVDWRAGRNAPITNIDRKKTTTRTSSQTNTNTTTGSSTTTGNNTTTNNSSTNGTTTDVGDTGPITGTTETRTQTIDNTGVTPTTDVTVIEDVTNSGTAGRSADTTTTTTTTGSTATTGSTSTTGLSNSATTGTGLSTSDTESKATDGTWLSDTYSTSKPFAGGGFNRDEGGWLRFGILTDQVDIDFVLSMLHKEIGAKLLANPRILVLDNELAKFKAVREIPYQQLQQGGYQSFGTTEFKDVGVELAVTPHLTKDGMIRLHIIPSFSIHVDDVTISLAGSSVTTMPQPVVDKREADTIALIKDGQTVVIGGLKKKETTREVRKVPILGEIPLLGNLFRSEGESIVNSELVVFITPRIVEQPVLSEREIDNLKATEIENPVIPTSIIKPNKK